MTAPPPEPDTDGSTAHCRRCQRPLEALTSKALHFGPTCFRKVVGAAGRRVVAVHEGQLVLDLDENELAIPEQERSAA